MKGREKRGTRAVSEVQAPERWRGRGLVSKKGVVLDFSSGDWWRMVLPGPLEVVPALLLQALEPKLCGMTEAPGQATSASL